MKKITSLFVLGIIILFAACQKENIDLITPKNPGYKPDSVEVNSFIASMKTFGSDTLYLDCVEIPLPIDLKKESGATITISTSAQFNALTPMDSVVDFVYPFDVYVNNNKTTIDNIEDFVIALTLCDTTTYDCGDQDAHVLLFFNALDILTRNNYAYDIKYPVDLVVEGKQVTLNKDDDYLPAIGGSPFDYLETELVYPITIRQFGRDIVLKDDEDVCDFYATLDEDCVNKPAHIQFFYNEGPGTAISCTYFVNYPVDVKLNGSTIRLNSRDSYITLLDTSSTAYTNLQLDYPVSATKYDNGQTITFSSDSDICNYLDNCK